MYDSMIKDMHRAVVRAAYQRAQRGGILYLEDAEGTATRYFLADRVDRRDLTPVNWDASACERIQRTTGVVATCADIDSVVEDVSVDSHAVVWLDYMCRDVSTEVLRAALSAAPTVVVTLSQRGATRNDQIRDVHARCKSAGGAVTETALYRGVSGIQNMVKFVIERALTTAPAAKKLKSSSLKSSSLKRAREDALKSSSLKSSSLKRAREDALVDRTLVMPVDLWTTPVDEPVRVRRGSYVLRVMEETNAWVRVAHYYPRSSCVYPCERWTLSRKRALEFLEK